jgi:hypothetical protein
MLDTVAKEMRHLYGLGNNLAIDRRYPRHWHWCERRAKF